jgi:GT2 family glycosyltransferase
VEHRNENDSQMSTPEPTNQRILKYSGHRIDFRMDFTDVANPTEAKPLYRIKTPTKALVLPRTLRTERPHVRGKFLSVGDNKFLVRGVTYGTFRPNRHGTEYPDQGTVERDFAVIRSGGFNTVRTYTIPPRWVLDAAHKNGLYLMLGFPWEQHITFLDDKERASDIERRLINDIRECAGHPAVLAYTIGNEIPAPIIRWLGRRRVEKFLERLYKAVKNVDPQALVTYVNYPTTEYLDLDFIDFVTFNVYLESEDRLRAYVARLQNIAGDRPLIMSEVGLDSRRNGEGTQAKVLDWQIRTIFAGGCAGVFVFAWTDEWHRGGHEIEDWDFGLTTRDRKPKPALDSVRKAFSEIPFPNDCAWPAISVIVCSYNGSQTLRQCLDSLKALTYPNFEVIVVNDGSTDGTETIAKNSGFRLITTENCGLSHARNVGLRAATAEIVAYIDDDAYPDLHWLTYLAFSFINTSHAGIGGPNVPPANDGPIADCVAHAPGGPVHVLLSDDEAEHIPGCNMAFRRAALLEVGGFDEQFCSAGDDVDMCWRLQEKGFTLGFSPAAMVWHHRRNSVLAYWKQQVGYGKAEALLERKWPEKYNAAGHLTWGGRVYGNGHTVMLGRSWRVYYGMWGTAPFQPRYENRPGLLLSLPLMPEWYLVILALAWLTALGTLWSPLFFALPLLVAALAAPLLQALLSSIKAPIPNSNRSLFYSVGLRGLTTFLHLVQPLARLCGRLRYDLTPWRKRGVSAGTMLPRPRRFSLWSERWQSAAERLHAIKSALRATGASVTAGHSFADWDLEIRDGVFGAVHMRMAIEEHGAGKQLVRLCCWPTCSSGVLTLALVLLGLSLGAVVSHAWLASLALAGVGLVLSLQVFQDCATASAAVVQTLEQLGISETG